MQVPIGWCTDRFNLYWLYAGAFTLWCLGQGLTGLAGTLTVLILFRVILGIGESIYLPAITKIVTVLFAPSERGLPSGISGCGVRMGLVLGGVFVPWLLVHYGWRHAFLMIGFGALLWLIPWLSVYPARLHATYDEQRVRHSSVAEYVRNALANRSLLGICLGFFCFDYYWYVLVTWLPDYLVTVRHLSLLHAGFIASAGFLVFGTAEATGAWAADYFTRRGWNETRTRKGIVTIAFLCGIFLIAAIRVSDTRLAIALLMGACLVGLAPSNIMVIVQCCAPPEHVGVWTGVENFAGNLAGVIAPLAIGLLIKWTGSYVPGFALGAFVLLSGITMFWLVVGELKSRAE
jgi:MFS family permease